MRVQLAYTYTNDRGQYVGAPDEVVELPDDEGNLLIREGRARRPDDETGAVGLSTPKPDDTAADIQEIAAAGPEPVAGQQGTSGTASAGPSTQSSPALPNQEG